MEFILKRNSHLQPWLLSWVTLLTLSGSGQNVIRKDNFTNVITSCCLDKSPNLHSQPPPRQWAYGLLLISDRVWTFPKRFRNVYRQSSCSMSDWSRYSRVQAVKSGHGRGFAVKFVFSSYLLCACSPSPGGQNSWLNESQPINIWPLYTNFVYTTYFYRISIAADPASACLFAMLLCSFNSVVT